MSEEKKPPRTEDQTTTLHLGEFAPGQNAGVHAGTRAGAGPGEENTTTMFKQAAAEAAQQSSQPVVAPADAGALPPTELLGAVSYSYAKGVFRSEDIERKMRQDPTLQQTLSNQLPDAKAIRRFRRFNREAILGTLARVFRRRRKQTAGATVLPTLPGADPAPPAPHAPSGAESQTTRLARQEAEQRLDNAAWVDNMSKDD